jgi:hypothetical protein
MKNTDDTCISSCFAVTITSQSTKTYLSILPKNSVPQPNNALQRRIGPVINVITFERSHFSDHFIHLIQSGVTGKKRPDRQNDYQAKKRQNGPQSRIIVK